MDLPDRTKEIEETESPEIGNGDITHFLTEDVQKHLDMAALAAYKSAGGRGPQPEVKAFEELLGVYAEKPYGMYAVRKMLFDTAHTGVALHYSGITPGVASTVENVALQSVYRAGRYSALMEMFQFLSEPNLRNRLDVVRSTVSST